MADRVTPDPTHGSASKPATHAKPKTPRARPTATRTGVAVMAKPGSDESSSPDAPTDAPIPERLTLQRASIGQAQAVQADVNQTSIGRLHAVDVAVNQSAIGFARGDKVSVEYGVVGLSIAGATRISQAGVRTVLARDVHFEQGIIGSSISATARFERSSAVLFLIARRVEGNVKVMFDWRGALAFGAGVGLLLGLLRRR